MKVSYYPGCSLHSTGIEYNESTQQVCQALGIELQELDDWNCCGAGSAHCTDEALSIELPARNLAIAEKSDLDLVIPCAACFLRFKVAEKHIRDGKEPIIETSYEGKVPVKHLLGFFCEEENLKKITEKIQKPLKGLKVACYYGCLITRPPKITDAKEYENPNSMDELLTKLGAETVGWAYKTDCCGGSLLLSRPDIVVKLTGNLIQKAKEAGADCIVTACPLCQANIDTKQGDISRALGEEVSFPTFYFTELLGYALGSGDFNKWIDRHIIDTSGLLKTQGLI